MLYGSVAVVATGVGLYLLYLNRQADLKPWHTASLAAEFRAQDAAAVPDFGAYLEREERLFQQLRTEVLDRTEASDRRELNRYSAGSRTDPTAARTNWNRTFVLRAPSPRGAALLLHGLSDSPYSLRALGQALNRDRFHVIGLRLPGHGAAPVGLTRATLEDFAAATRLAMRQLRQDVGDGVPLFLVGYSNGGALAVDYALSRLEGEDVPEVKGLVLLSPAIGITAGAALASWQRRLSLLPGMEKVAWQSVSPEYDPYKFNSFPVNAGEQIHRLTHRIDARIERLKRGSGLAGFPPVLAFQSVVDSTIVPRAVIDRFLGRLDAGGHELVLFDLHRGAEARALMVGRPETFSEVLMADTQTPFAVSVVTSVPGQPGAVRLLQRAAGTNEARSTALELTWPRGIFSLSHVAVPFPPSDPWYGDGSGTGSESLPLGHLEVRGENGVLVIPPATLQRLRYNPFFPYLERRVLEFCRSPGASAR